MDTIWEYTTLSADDAYVISINKVGGGTVGKDYVGEWDYQICDEDKIFETGTASFGMPKTHAMAATDLYDRWLSKE